MEIRDMVPETEILAQMAVEALELKNAVARLRRLLDAGNPKQADISEAWTRLLEEYGDVQNCAEQLLSGIDMDVCAVMRAERMLEWKRQIESEMDGNVSGP